MNMHMGLFVVAMALSAVSAYYSILGLAAIFAASWWSVVILASILEVGKLVLASWLYGNWREINFLIRTYLTLAVITLMLITSVGTFGFLSQAHAEQDAQAAQTQLQLNHIENQTQVKQSEIAQLSQTLAQLDRSINIQLDANRATGALNARRQQQAERAQLQERITAIQAEIQQLNNQKLSLNEVQISQETKLGPIRYVIAIVDPDSDPAQAVKWLILVLVMVCDPLAVLMVMASSVRKQSDVVDPIMPGTIRYWASEWQAYTGSEWQPVQSAVTQSHVTEPTHAPQPIDIKPLAQIVEQTVTELLRQRPIMEMGVRPHAAAPDHVRTKSDLDMHQLQKSIEQTLESWMNKTLTVTYTADQMEIDSIVEKVIARTTAPVVSTPVSEPIPTESPLPVQPEHSQPPAPTEPEPVVASAQVATPDVTDTQPDPAGTRPIYNYFGEERVRGGKKHNITT